MFLERLNSTGMMGSKYWYDRNWNKGAKTVNGLANCTCFCVGEIYEQSEKPSAFQLFGGLYSNPGAFPVAKNWYSLWVGKKGIEPKIGGVCVWGANKGDGHVAYVLDTKDVGKDGAWVKVCQSNFGGKYFEVKEYTVKKGVVTAGVGYPYIGCCYNAVNDKRTTRNTDLLQVQVKADMLNVRDDNGKAYSGRFCPKGLYTILDTKKDDYTWAKIDNNCWIALNDKDGWTVTYQPTSNISLEQRYTALLNAYDILSQKYSDLLMRYEKETGKYGN